MQLRVWGSLCPNLLLRWNLVSGTHSYLLLFQLLPLAQFGSPGGCGLTLASPSPLLPLIPSPAAPVGYTCHPQHYPTYQSGPLGTLISSDLLG